ncbi:MAG: carboxypeptidase regulatory-like domain-containing protein [Fuerstia sp.]|nr:carboxypeptidase regulatory-like domain-containing protein [Fuerstiella sp.]
MVRFNLRHNSIAKSVRNGTCLLLAALLAVGSPVMAGEPVEIRSSDVALNAGGLLNGTVLNTAAQPVAGVAVNVLHEDKVVATAMSNEQGEFSVKGLRNGAHVVKVGTTVQAVRLWGTDTAPPAAVENIAIVVDDEAVRGQMGSFIRSPAGALVLIGGVVAIVLGTTLDDDDAPASP